MAKFMDLPPELRVAIYDFLLVEPISQGQRITFTLKSQGESKWDRVKIEDSNVNVASFTVHHLDFSNLMSLARVNRVVYQEASPIIYHHADLSYSLDRSYKTATPHSVLEPLEHFLDNLSLTTREMLHTLTINDEYASASPRDTKLLVKLMESHLPQMKKLTINPGRPSTGKTFDERLDHFAPILCRTMRGIRPLARLRGKLSVSVNLPAWSTESWPLKKTPSEEGRMEWTMLSSLVQIAVDMLGAIASHRNNARASHALARKEEYYLQVTSALRSAGLSTAVEDVDERLEVIEEELKLTDDTHIRISLFKRCNTMPLSGRKMT